jgi:1,4-dihydroxy-6-naphthoate synthase
MEAVRLGEVDAGAIIHEGRFTFPRYGLEEVVDLGAWWEQETGHPIPLGGILARRDLPSELVSRIDRGLAASVAYSREHEAEVLVYVREHAQELEEDVVRAHIRLYVNRHTLEYGRDGEAAIGELMRRAEAAGIVPATPLPLFM